MQEVSDVIGVCLKTFRLHMKKNPAIQAAWDTGHAKGNASLRRMLMQMAPRSAPVLIHLSATYYDTADQRLAASKITLRRRTGGTDEG